MLFQLTPSAMPDGYGDALLPLDACKGWLSLEAEVEEFDTLLAIIRDAAIDGVEKYVNQFMGPRTGVVATLAGFGPRMRLGWGPSSTVAVSAIDYLDADGAAAVLTASDWRWTVDGLAPAIGACWPSRCTQVVVTFNAGYPAGGCPPALKTAALMFVAHLFANREALLEGGLSGDLPGGVTWLCDRVRMPVL